MVTLSSLAAHTGAEPTSLRVVEVYGERGDKAGQFQYPTGLAVDLHGNSLRRGCPQSPCPAHHAGRRCGRSGRARDGTGPVSVAAGGRRRRRRFVLRCGARQWPRPEVHAGRRHRAGLRQAGPGRGRVHRPDRPRRRAGSGDIFVADTGNSRVQRFDYLGRFLNVIGAPGGYFPHLSSPQAVSDRRRGRPVCGRHAGRASSVLRPAGAAGQADRRPKDRAGEKNAPVSFHQPRALATDPAGLLYVADGGAPDPITGETRGRVQCFSQAEGRLLATVEKTGRGLGALLRPGGLAVGPPANAQRGAQKRKAATRAAICMWPTR